MMARSIVSAGTELSRAFWTAARRVGFPSRSLPPLRAATSICLMSFAKSFPRALSAAPFLCLMECHFECPLIAFPR